MTEREKGEGRGGWEKVGNANKVEQGRKGKEVVHGKRKKAR